MVENEINDLKENFYKLLYEMNSSLKKDISKVNSALNEKYKENQDKLNLAILKNEELFYKMINEKNNSEKIGQLNISHKKLNDMIMSQELKIKELISSNQRLTLNYDRIITDNLTVPGFVGSSCTYRTLSDYIMHNIKEIEKIKAEKEAEKRLVDDIKYKVDGLMKNILNIIDSSITRCNNYTDNKQKFLEEFVENKFKEINEKSLDHRAQVFTNINEIKKQVNDFEIKINDLKNMKIAIKEEIDNIIVDFKEKLENQEEQMTKNLENKIKENFEKMILQEKENNAQSQSQTNSKKNKYSKRNTKLSVSYNKSFSERKNGSLYNTLNIKASKTDNEKTPEEKFDKGRNMNKKKTQIYTFNRDFKFLQMANKIDEDKDLSESVHSQKTNTLNDSNENNLVNEDKKDENNNQNKEENNNKNIEENNNKNIEENYNKNKKENSNKNKEEIKKEKKDNNKPEIKLKEEDIEIEVIKPKKKSKVFDKKFEEKKLFNKIDKKTESKPKNEEIKMEKIIEIDNESRSKENEEKEINEEEEKNLEKKNYVNVFDEEEEKKYKKKDIEINIEREEEKKLKKKNDKINKEEKNNFSYQNEKKNKPAIERKAIKIIKNYESKDDENYNLNLEMKNEENIKNSNNQINFSLTKILDDNTVQEDTSDEVKKIQIQEMINNRKEDNSKSNKIQKKNFKSRNYTFQNINTYSSQTNFHSFNNINKEMKLIKTKSEIEPMNISSKLNSNSQTCLYFYKEKEPNKESDLKAISGERMVLHRSPLKLYLKGKKFSLPRIYCNFKLINLGSNIHFQRNIIQIVQPKDRAKENKKSNIDFNNSLINTYKMYQKRQKEQKNFNIFDNIYQNSQNIFSLNESKKSESELIKKEVGKLLNMKNNNSKNT